ncbi:MAG: hypothetical protein DBX55_02830 [Verrucomicrobia bacterium]|nr:MAG: hypothetical protein DBX55_02830 [Verrucomicrobiota bacterium]
MAVARCRTLSCGRLWREHRAGRIPKSAQSGSLFARRAFLFLYVSFFMRIACAGFCASDCASDCASFCAQILPISFVREFALCRFLRAGKSSVMTWTSESWRQAVQLKLSGVG